MSFSEALKFYLKKMSIRELASRTGISKSYLSMLVNGRLTKPPSPEKIRKIENSLNIPDGELLQHSPSGGTLLLQELSVDPKDAKIILEFLNAATKDKKIINKLPTLYKK